ncbi:MAG TPA: FAD-binding oxidoreductase [Niabella sp.]|nr:FAD-binding oxidoreductase [Niabella sp.]HOZ95781.1 FAD-binding oxidoreductase [Niabella sp.]HQW13635.1 FAD-binding oxidoreductase [Niabella sp.]HQX19029.1 FAD-binding oxidoreductase [Niabella sp.]HQX40861.1 FAD-binding oxidoreductase [Niabella sp.]
MSTVEKKTEVIIVGQGLSGTFLSWCLEQQGVDYIVIDNNAINASSKASSGVINPVTGRRVVTVWMDEIIIPFAEKTYQQIGNFLNIEAISKTGIIDFFPNPFMKESFLKKIELQAPYIELISEEEPYQPLFNFEFGIGKIQPAFVVHLPKLLPAWQEFLLQHNKLINSAFLFSKLVVAPEKIIYDNIEAKQIVFCDGVEGNRNPYFSLLPFALNKGEALIIEAPEVSNEFIYKKSVALVPYGKDGLFWAGSNYIWDFDDDQPTETFRKSTEVALKNWLKVPFKILEHKAAIRPATVERRPFVGFHPKFQNVGILNGLGTKGCSLAPYFAHQLSDHIINGTGIEKEADLGRFSGILSRTSL